MADLIFTVDYKQVKQANQEITNIGTSAKKSAGVFEQAFKRAERSQQQYMRNVKQQITFSKRMEAQKAKESAAAVKAAQASAREEERLKAKYVQGYTAMNIYTKELNDLAMARKRDLISADQQKDAVAQLNAQMAAGTGIFANHSGAVGRNTRAMGRGSVITQQAGYQVGDFLVQVQSGTNAMVAFGQQATQVAGTLTILGGKWVAIGTALGITIPLVTAVGAYFMRTAKSADETSKSVENLEDNLKSLDSALQDWVRTKKAASMGLTVDELLGTESLEDATDNLREARLELERISTAAALTGVGAAGGIDLFNLLGMGEQAQFDAAVQKVVDAENRLAVLRQRDSDKRLSNFQEEYQAQMDNLDLQRTIAQFGSDSRQTRALELQQEIDSYNRQIDLQVQQNDLTVAHGVALKKAFEEATRLEATIEDGKIMSEKLADGFDAAKVKLGELAEEALTLRDRLLSAAGAAYAIVQDTHETMLRSNAVGRGRGMSAGPTAEEIQTNDPAAQLAYSQMDWEERLRREAEKAKDKDKDTESPLEKLRKELSLMEELVGKTQEYRYVREALGDEYKNVSAETIAGLEAQYKAVQELIRLEEEHKANLQSIADVMKSSMSDAFMSMVEGTKTVGDAFKNMARLIIKQLFDVLVVQQIVGSFNMATGVGSGIVGSIMGGITGGAAPVAQANGGAWNKGVQMFANGGVVNSPTMFGHSGGVGVMGEAGPEAIMPLKRGANGKLGVQMEGGSQPVVIHQNFNFSANGDESVKRIIASEAPKIANLTQKQIMDQRRRGGSMKSTFG